MSSKDDYSGKSQPEPMDPEPEDFQRDLRIGNLLPVLCALCGGGTDYAELKLMLGEVPDPYICPACVPYVTPGIPLDVAIAQVREWQS